MADEFWAQVSAQYENDNSKIAAAIRRVYSQYLHGFYGHPVDVEETKNYPDFFRFVNGRVYLDGRDVVGDECEGVNDIVQFKDFIKSIGLPRSLQTKSIKEALAGHLHLFREFSFRYAALLLTMYVPIERLDRDVIRAVLKHVPIRNIKWCYEFVSGGEIPHDFAMPAAPRPERTRINELKVVTPPRRSNAEKRAERDIIEENASFWRQHQDEIEEVAKQLAGKKGAHHWQTYVLKAEDIVAKEYGFEPKLVPERRSLAQAQAQARPIEDMIAPADPVPELPELPPTPHGKSEIVGTPRKKRSAQKKRAYGHSFLTEQNAQAVFEAAMLTPIDVHMLRDPMFEGLVDEKNKRLNIDYSRCIKRIGTAEGILGVGGLLIDSPEMKKAANTLKLLLYLYRGVDYRFLVRMLHYHGQKLGIAGADKPSELQKIPNGNILGCHEFKADHFTREMKNMALHVRRDINDFYLEWHVDVPSDPEFYVGGKTPKKVSVTPAKPKATPAKPKPKPKAMPKALPKYWDTYWGNDVKDFEAAVVAASKSQAPPPKIDMKAIHPAMLPFVKVSMDQALMIGSKSCDGRMNVTKFLEAIQLPNDLMSSRIIDALMVYLQKFAAGSYKFAFANLLIEISPDFRDEKACKELIAELPGENIAACHDF